MSRIDKPDPNLSKYEREAAQWVARLNRDDVNEADLALFEKWRRDDNAKVTFAKYELLLSKIGGFQIPSAKIQTPPAHLLARVGNFLLPRTLFVRYVEPHIQDIRAECYPALKDGKHWLARWIVFRGYCYALWSLFYPIIRKLFREK